MHLVFAIMRDGRRVGVAAKHGTTVEDVVAGITADTLTGSAEPLTDVELTTVDGDTIRYGDVNSFEGVSGFLS